MYSDHPEATYGQRYRTRVEHFGLPTPLRRKQRNAAIGEDRYQMAWDFPRDLAPVRRIDLATVEPTQPSVINRALRSHLAKPGRTGYHKDAHPYLLIVPGHRFLWDGHHRTCLALARGETSLLMQVMDLTDPGVVEVFTEHMAAEEALRVESRKRLDALGRTHGPIFPLRTETYGPWNEIQKEDAARRAVLTDTLSTRLTAVLAA